MLKISFKSSKKPAEILADAESFFVRQGLKPARKENNGIRFEGDRGYVHLDVTHASEVTVETTELEPLVKQFAERVK